MTTRNRNTTEPDLKRRFGIELEYHATGQEYGSELRDTVRDRLEENGLEARNEGYTHSVESHWKVVYDGSLRNEGVEIVSPILKNLNSTKRACAAMSKVCDDGLTRTGMNAGLHVHVEVKDATTTPELRAQFIKNLMTIWNKISADVKLHLPKSRRTASWCRWHKYSPERLGDRCDRDYMCNFLENANGDNRYTALNFLSMRRYNTVEFRCAASTVNFEKVKRWVNFCQALVDFAACGTTATEQTRTAAREVLDDLTLELIKAEKAEKLRKQSIEQRRVNRDIIDACGLSETEKEVARCIAFFNAPLTDDEVVGRYNDNRPGAMITYKTVRWAVSRLRAAGLPITMKKIDGKVWMFAMTPRYDCKDSIMAKRAERITQPNDDRAEAAAAAYDVLVKEFAIIRKRFSESNLILANASNTFKSQLVKVVAHILRHREGNPLSLTTLTERANVLGERTGARMWKPETVKWAVGQLRAGGVNVLITRIDREAHYSVFVDSDDVERSVRERRTGQIAEQQAVACSSIPAEVFEKTKLTDFCPVEDVNYWERRKAQLNPVPAQQQQARA